MPDRNFVSRHVPRPFQAAARLWIREGLTLVTPDRVKTCLARALREDGPEVQRARQAARARARQAWQFGRSLVADDWSETRRLWPSLELVPDAERERVVDLMQRYGEEWAKLMNERPGLRRHFGWPESTAA